MTPRERAVLAVDSAFGYTLEFAPGCDQHFQAKLYDMVEEAIIAERREAIEECARVVDCGGFRAACPAAYSNGTCMFSRACDHKRAANIRALLKEPRK